MGHWLKLIAPLGALALAGALIALGAPHPLYA
jgi:hypothetical protein